MYVPTRRMPQHPPPATAHLAAGRAPPSSDPQRCREAGPAPHHGKVPEVETSKILPETCYGMAVRSRTACRPRTSRALWGRVAVAEGFTTCKVSEKSARLPSQALERCWPTSISRVMLAGMGPLVLLASRDAWSSDATYISTRTEPRGVQSSSRNSQLLRQRTQRQKMEQVHYKGGASAVRWSLSTLVLCHRTPNPLLCKLRQMPRSARRMHRPIQGEQGCVNACVFAPTASRQLRAARYSRGPPQGANSG
jgi:hypothetical protein